VYTSHVGDPAREMATDLQARYTCKLADELAAQIARRQRAAAAVARDESVCRVFLSSRGTTALRLLAWARRLLSGVNSIDELKRANFAGVT
jgi:hypothetical protein